jgi:hypothetical protein
VNGQFDQGFPYYSSTLWQTCWYAKSALHRVLVMQLSRHQIKNFLLNASSPTLSKPHQKCCPQITKFNTDAPILSSYLLRFSKLRLACNLPLPEGRASTQSGNLQRPEFSFYLPVINVVALTSFRTSYYCSAPLFKFWF